MTIATVDELDTALNARYSKYISNKNDPIAGNATVGGFHSYWRGTGVPTQPAIPTTGTNAALNHLSTGAILFMQQTSPKASYLGALTAACSVSGSTLEIHDRLLQRAGLDGRSTGTQTTTGFDLNSFLSTNNIGNRIGDANYSDVQWWLEWYANTGTAANATVNVTYNDGTTGNLTAIALGATVRASRMIPLNSSIPAADSGKYIRGINSVTLSADTGTTGNFGVTATRYRASVFMPSLNRSYNIIWAESGLPEIYNESCLFPVGVPTTASVGNMRIDGSIVYG